MSSLAEDDLPPSSQRKPNAASATVIPVLGMHRSGTSMITRALNLMGLELGQPLLDPTADNPNGYWENSFFVRINAELLKTMSCDENGFGSFDQLTQLPQMSDRISVDGDKLCEIRDFMQATFTSGTWGWKDPRTVLTFGVWQRMLADLKFTNVRPVVIVRHPESTIQSLVRRVQRDASNQIPPERLGAMASEIWLAYNTILWDRLHRSNETWFVGLYESFVDSTAAEAELRRLAAWCGLDETKVAKSLSSIVPRGGSTAGHSAASDEAMELYDRFRQLAAKQSNTNSTTIVSIGADERRLIQRATDFKQNGRIDAAVELLEKGLAIRPQYRSARYLLGHTLMETGHITKSARQAKLLIAEAPEDAVGHGLNAFGLTQQAAIPAAIKAFRECIRYQPDNSIAWSNLLFTSLYGDHHDAAGVTKLHREAGQEIAKIAAAKTTAAPFKTQARRMASGETRLRIGYLSGDFKKHPVGYFLRSILANHDRSRFEVTCYDIGAGHDDLTEILKGSSEHWCNARSLDSDQLLNQIRGDRIDILIDLCGHSAGNAAGVITRRAAPVQATYIGYPCTTGLPNMDVILSDSHVNPPEFDDLYTEQVHRLPNCFLCFHPHEDAPAVAPSPCERNGFVTFGSFNNLPKIGPSTVRLWANILHAVKDARLVLKTLSFVDEGTRELFYSQFAARGVDRSRIDLLPPTVPLAKFLDEYRRIDIALDSIPYGGGTTTCESLWMGVPVITMPGQHFFSRMTTSILNAVGLQEFIADSPEDYVSLAARLAANPKRIQQQRSLLRAQVAGSPLCDSRQFAADLESVYARLAAAIH